MQSIIHAGKSCSVSTLSPGPGWTEVGVLLVQISAASPVSQSYQYHLRGPTLPLQTRVRGFSHSIISRGALRCGVYRIRIFEPCLAIRRHLPIHSKRQTREGASTLPSNDIDPAPGFKSLPMPLLAKSYIRAIQVDQLTTKVNQISHNTHSHPCARLASNSITTNNNTTTKCASDPRADAIRARLSSTSPHDL